MIVESVIATITAIVAAYLWEVQIRGRVRIRQIRSAEDRWVTGFLELYSNLFLEDGTNYSCEEMLEFTQATPGDRHVEVENIILAAIYRGEVVGFLLCHFYPERRKAIISYFGVNKEVLEARNGAATVLLKKLKKVLSKRRRSCEFIFFDMQGVEEGLPPEEVAKRRARPVLFRQSARTLKMKSVTFDFPYRCPKVSLAPGTREYPFSLMCVPLSRDIPKPAPRALVISFLEFLYLDCYGDVYPVSDPRFAEHHAYLESVIADYRGSLPEFVPWH